MNTRATHSAFAETLTKLAKPQRVFICSVLHRPPLWPIWQVVIEGKRYSNLNQGLLKELQSGTTPEELGLDPDDEEDNT